MVKRKNNDTYIKKPSIADIEGFGYKFSEKDVFVKTINGTSNVEGKNNVSGKSLNYVTVLPDVEYNRFRIERSYYGDIEDEVFGEFEDVMLQDGKTVKAINLEFDNIKCGTHINIHCLKDEVIM